MFLKVFIDPFNLGNLINKGFMLPLEWFTEPMKYLKQRLKHQTVSI